MPSLVLGPRVKLVAAWLALVAAATGLDVAGCKSNIETQPTAASSTTGSSTTGTGGKTATSSVTTNTTVTTGAGAAGGGGSSGTGGTPSCVNATGTEKCPGDTIPLMLGSTVSDCGDTSKSMSHLYTSADCGMNEPSGPELVYHLTFPAPMGNVTNIGSFKFKVTATKNDFSPLVLIRANPTKAANCEMNDQTCLATFAGAQQGVAFELNPKVFPDVYAIVSGRQGKSGLYRLDVSYTAPKCGDGVLNSSTNEQCDDGNTVDGDGCSHDCLIETITQFDACPGELFSIAQGQSFTFNSSTIPYRDGDGVNPYFPAHANMNVGTCTTSDYAAAQNAFNMMQGGKDRVYQLNAKSDGTITATVGQDITGMYGICDQDVLDPGCWDSVLYAVAAINPDTCSPNCSCADMNGALNSAQLDCSHNASFVQTVKFPVSANHSYFIIVDGNPLFGRNTGNFYLHVSLQ